MMIKALAGLLFHSLVWGQTPVISSLWDGVQADLQKERYEQARQKIGDILVECGVLNPDDSPECFARAKFALADTYYKEYGRGKIQPIREMAGYHFREFQAAYPFHPQAAEAQFKIGMLCYRNILSPYRDTEFAERAQEEFSILLRNYPQGPFAEDAKKLIAKVREVLAEHELYVAQFYFQKKSFQAAASRLEELARDYPDFPKLQVVLNLLEKARKRAP